MIIYYGFVVEDFPENELRFEKLKIFLLQNKKFIISKTSFLNILLNIKLITNGQEWFNNEIW